MPITTQIGIAFLAAIAALNIAAHNWRKFDTRAFPEGSQKGVAVEVQNAIHDSFGGGGGTAAD